MTVEEFYKTVDGDYDEIMKRMMKEERILKFLGMFQKDATYEKLCQAMESKQYDEAFREAHTLKGLCSNMSFKGLFVPAEALTESLRGGNYAPVAEEYFAQVKEKYGIIRSELEKLL